MRRALAAGLAAVFVVTLAAPAWARPRSDWSGRASVPTLQPGLVAYYDFEHPVRSDRSLEQDRAAPSTDLDLVNGGADMRVRDGAFPARNSLQLKQVSPTVAGNDDWKAGLYSADRRAVAEGVQRGARRRRSWAGSR